MLEYGEATKRFLLAAKYAELDALQQLSANCRVVKAVKDVIHQFQRERGISNIFLATGAVRFSQQRNEQENASIQAEQVLRSLLKSLYLNGSESSANMRLLSSITLALEGMDNLPVLRRKVTHLEISPLESTQAYSRLIAVLLSVIFEAADVASDPSITKVLVALFNFIQGKEYAGQERAWGAIGFAEARFDKHLCERLKQLQACQQQHFDVFCEFARKPDLSLWRGLSEAETTHAVERLRNIICQLADGSHIASEISEVWYEKATLRIDAMHQIEEQLTSYLMKIAASRVEEASTELRDHRKRLRNLSNNGHVNGSPLTMLFDPQFPGLQGDDSQLPIEASVAGTLSAHRSFYDLLKEQAEHIKRVSSELDAAKRAITEQKLVDRAKLLIMQQLNCSEAQAYRMLQANAMNNNKRIFDVAGNVVEQYTSGNTQYLPATID